MASTNETGHPINLANFDIVIAEVISYGGTYNPSKADLKLTALQELAVACKAASGAVSDAESVFRTATQARDQVTEQLNPLVTKIINAFEASGATRQEIQSGRSLVRKLQGHRAIPKSAEPNGAATESISVSQMSVDSRIENFDKLLKLLASVAVYAPNEANLKITALTAYLDDLRAKNSALVTATVTLNKARNARNEIMYKDETGMVDMAYGVKSYVKSVFGASSPQYKSISKIKFTKPRK